MQNLQRRACQKFKNNCLYKQSFRTRERNQSEGHLGLKPGIQGCLLRSWLSSRLSAGPGATALQALCLVRVAWVVIAAAGGGRGTALGLGLHSPEHPGRSGTSSPGRGPAGLAVAEVVTGVAGVISAALPGSGLSPPWYAARCSPQFSYRSLKARLDRGDWSSSAQYSIHGDVRVYRRRLGEPGSGWLLLALSLLKVGLAMHPT